MVISVIVDFFMLVVWIRYVSLVDWKWLKFVEVSEIFGQ